LNWAMATTGKASVMTRAMRVQSLIFVSPMPVVTTAEQALF
jgi:hypothetical protein